LRNKWRKTLLGATDLNGVQQLRSVHLLLEGEPSNTSTPGREQSQKDIASEIANPSTEQDRLIRAAQRSEL